MTQPHPDPDAFRLGLGQLLTSRAARQRLRAAVRQLPPWKRALWQVGLYWGPDTRTPAQRRRDGDLNLFALAALGCLFAGFWQGGLVIAAVMLAYTWRP